ncbi:phospho-sugar mutase [Hazenella coriacea]|uniref:Phosphoglucomutase n=1 Tax=Hazenella coriacea TaxID=1179467 RepID=A0A4R3L1Y8_9BACL|nr:phospho-sugar mutase [Hazenella coriacea]TCS93631.1 alpha-phosphoglucomutase [Hazenella coriacea]
MKSFDIYQQWLQSPYIDLETKQELQGISEDASEIEDHFYKHLEFGTGGVRGILGAGRNRINRYTIRRITQGIADYISTFGDLAKQKGVVIAYDSRHQSKELALETAFTFQYNGIQPYLFKEVCPTPLLSFSVRELGAITGIVITASHNPPMYNGYKVYGADGGQIVPSIAREIQKKIDRVEEIPSHAISSEQYLDKINWLDNEISESYVSRLQRICLHPEVTSSLTIVYTPLHGVGNRLVQRVLCEAGFTQVYSVPEQEQPDPDFPTVLSPNPEEPQAFRLAMELGKEKNADLLVATDPDADRVGIAVKNEEGEYEVFTGNQVGVLLLNYLLSERTKQGTLPDEAVVVKTIVTSQMGKAIAERYGVETIETHTGFKYIGEQIEVLEKGRHKKFLFGYEESCGYLTDTFVRDKDGIMTTLLICEMVAYYKSINYTLKEVLYQLYQEYGYFIDHLESRTFTGKEGMNQIQSIMRQFRLKMPTQIGLHSVTKVCDYAEQVCLDRLSQKRSKLTLPQENVLAFTLEDGSWFCLRPSGTEPKIKVYFSVCGETGITTQRRLDRLVQDVMEIIDQNH